jgi:hypothetical protein
LNNSEHWTWLGGSLPRFSHLLSQLLIWQVPLQLHPSCGLSSSLGNWLHVIGIHLHISIVFPTTVRIGIHSFPHFFWATWPTQIGEKRYAHVWGCMQPVPCAHAHLSTSAPCTPQYNIAEACGCNQPQAFGHMHRHRFPYFDWACATFPRTTHGTDKKDDSCRMHAVECLPLLAPTCLGIECPFFKHRAAQ